jgi:hypothetical protein
MQKTEISIFCKLIGCPRVENNYLLGMSKNGRYRCKYLKDINEGDDYECAYLTQRGKLKSIPSLDSSPPLNKDWQRDLIVLVSAFMRIKKNDKRSKKVASYI